jgi:phenylpropionate dioxygenase-like ring-hydroxylating dioxygenase large terminal subunit
MLSRQENALLTQAGPGTPLGDMLRRYWMPALLAWELPAPDCPPVRVKLLGESLVAFRETQGRLGLLDEFCPHRRASLFFGRNEECGLRCVYHGWKFDVDGRCVDMMNEPAEYDFTAKIRTQAYPAVELGGVIWTYMGPPALRPALPKFAWTQAPESHRHVSKVLQECNWLQALEGGIDTSHVPILHRTFARHSQSPGWTPDTPWVRVTAPTMVVEPTDYGHQYFGFWPINATEMHIRAYHFVMPFHQLRPSYTAQGHAAVAGHMWVPMDDQTCMVYNWDHSLTAAPLTAADRLEQRLGNGPEDVDQRHGFRSRRHKDNNYLLDRHRQKYETFTGIEGINTQDRAVQESMGRIVDRRAEHLGPADKAIIQARRLLLQAMRTVQAGATPPGVLPTYYTLQAVERVLPRAAAWRQVLLPEIALAAAANLEYSSSGDRGDGKGRDWC